MQVESRLMIEKLLGDAEPSAELATLFIIMRRKMIAYYHGQRKGDEEIAALMSINPESVKAVKKAMGLPDKKDSSYPSEWDMSIEKFAIFNPIRMELKRQDIYYFGQLIQLDPVKNLANLDLGFVKTALKFWKLALGTDVGTWTPPIDEFNRLTPSPSRQQMVVAHMVIGQVDANGKPLRVKPEVDPIWESTNAIRDGISDNMLLKTISIDTDCPQCGHLTVTRHCNDAQDHDSHLKVTDTEGDCALRPDIQIIHPSHSPDEFNACLKAGYVHTGETSYKGYKGVWGTHYILEK